MHTILGRLGLLTLWVFAALIAYSGFSALTTYPQADGGAPCGAMPFVVVVSGGTLSGLTAGSCRLQAWIQIAIGIGLIALALLLAAAPRIARWAKARQTAHTAHERETGVWTTGPGGRAMPWIFIGGITLMSAAGIAAAPGWDTALIIALLLFPAAWLFLRFFHHQRVELKPDEIVIVRMFTTRHVPVEEVVGVTPPGYFGLFLRLRGGGTVRIPMGAKDRISEASGRRTQADDLMEAVAAHVAAARRVERSWILPTGLQKEASRKNAKAALIVGLFYVAILAIAMFAHK